MGGVAGSARVLLLGLLLALAGCSSTPKHGVTHVVRPGENVYRISRYYRVPMRDVIRANRIGDVTNVQVGERLFIPGARKAAPGETLAVAYAPPAPTPAEARDLARRESNLSFGWPVGGRPSSGFGWRNGQRHEGIDIPAKRGTPVRAAEAGRVIHSGGGLGAYGKVVIVKHAGRYSTVYAHNHKNLVRKGDFVEKGEVIARVGSTGNANGTHLHFEVRRDRRPHDPAHYLP
jgi:murein DD-endopeptidase MepM/ murein hydrolase activator NlpD